VAVVSREQVLLLHSLRRDGIRGFREARARCRLARAVRKYALDEREHRHRAGVIEFASIAARTALFEQIADCLEELDCPVAALGVERLECLLAEPAPFRDYGPAAKKRNARIESVLHSLDSDRASALANENYAARVDGRAAAFESDRSQRVEG
jgi:hypothetical protein